MPEAAINKHRQTNSRKQDVCFSAEIGKRAAMDKVAEASSVQLPPESHFRERVPTGMSAHSLVNGFAGGEVTKL
jgi:hypothetical protein